MLGYSKTEEYEAGQYKLTLDGKIIGDEYSYASVYGERRNAYVRDSDLYEQISVLTLNEILGDFTEVHFWYPNLLNDEVISFLLSDIIINRTNDNAITVKFEFNFNDSEWKQPWRMKDHIAIFESIFNSKDIRNLTMKILWDDSEPSDPIIEEIAVFTSIDNVNVVLNSAIGDYIKIFEDVNQETILRLQLAEYSNSVVIRVDFAEEVKVAYEQYLLYFVQFLKDIGIDATAELKEQANNVLFSVTPKDKDEALDNIREALHIYLRLSTINESSIMDVQSAEIETQRLSSQIYHLKSQLMLANATIQQKDMLIQQQQNFVQQYLTEQVIIQPNKQKDLNDSNDKESLVGDIVMLKQWEWEMLSVDFPTLLRRLKKYFRDKK